MTWKFVQAKGLILKEDTNIFLFFDQPRQTIRQQFHFNPIKNKGRADSEDDYQNLFDTTNNWVRLGFDNDRLFEIEVLEGAVEINGVNIRTQGNLTAALKALEEVGFEFSLGTYSYTDFDAKIDIGDSDLNGGVPNEVRWFYTAKNFDHFST
jgi:hypothetical protein